MPRIPLHLRSAPADPPLPVCAGWLPSADPRDWLVEAARVAGVAPGAAILFYPVAASVQDQRPCGAVLTVSGTQLPLDRIFGPQVHRLGEVHQKVLIPCNSRMEPALTYTEIAALFPWHLHFFHPALGLTGFEDSDGLHPWQLIQFPPVDDSPWFSAVPGPPSPAPWRHVSLVRSIESGDLPPDTGDDIGSRPGHHGNSAFPGSGMIEKATGAAAGLLGLMAAGMLRSAGRDQQASQLRKWSQRHWDEVKDRRSKEIHRLLDRFDKKDPDALRHAIPLTGASARRGKAFRPSWKLGSRVPDLYMDDGSDDRDAGEADVWTISAEIRLKLENEYRQAATVEAAAGRFGRAAYIYGHLLGQWRPAAEMLEKAGRPRDAARIWRERLQDNWKAADCLEKAGLLSEAAQLFQDSGFHENAGDVMLRLGDETAARQLWELHLKKMISFPLECARLIEYKMKEPDRAFQLLKSHIRRTKWEICLFEAALGVLARHGMHDRTNEWLDEIGKQPLPPAQTLNLIVGLRFVFTEYPDPFIRSRAATMAAGLAGAMLAGGAAPDVSRQILTLLPAFAPGDQLLARDASRFTKLLATPKPAGRSTSSAMHPARVVELDPSVRWDSMAASLEDLFVLGWKPAAQSEGAEILPILQKGTEGARQHLFTHTGFSAAPPRLTLHLAGSRRTYAVLHSGSNQRAAWRPPGSMVQATPCLAAGSGEGGEFLLLRVSETGTLVTDFYDADEGFRRTRVLDYAPEGISNGQWFAGMRADHLWLAGMDVVCAVTKAGEFLHLALPGPVQGMAIAPPFLQPQAIVLGPQAAHLVKVRRDNKALQTMELLSARSPLPPVACFNTRRWAIVADGHGGAIFDVSEGCRKLADIAVPPNSGGLVSASAGPHGGFALLSSRGQLFQYD